MAATKLSPGTLAELHVVGRATAATSRFVNPHVVAQTRRILVQRGELWAASVLGRDLSRRSRLYPRLPWLEDGEAEVLVLADEAEHDEG